MCKTGATTVSATMILAANANLKVFATGGVGGVHLDAEKTFDISVNLQELTNSILLYRQALNNSGFAKDIRGA